MPETIYKLQPHRTMHLQGFDSYGAAAALWGASDSAFSLSGVFRDQGDFAVLVLFQKHDPFGHPRFAYLPDGNLTGLKLDFDIEWQGIQAFESKRWPWIDWAYLNAYDANGNLLQHPLKQLATGPSGRTGASGVFTLEVGAPTAADRVTLWYQNRAFDYTVQSGASGGTSCVQAMWWQPASTSCEQDMWWQTVSGSCVQAMWWQGDHESCIQAMWWQGNSNYTHYVQIQSQSHGWNHIYGVQEDGLNSAGAAQAIAAQINSTDPYCGATVGGAYGNEITVFLKTLIALTDLVVSSSDGSATATLTMYVHWVQIGGNRYQTREDDMNSAQVAQALAGQINSSDPNCTATVGGVYNNEITIALKSGVAGPISVSSSDGSGTATLSDYVHWAQIGSARYSCNQGALSSAQIAANIAGQIAATDSSCTATAGGAQGNGVIISLRSGVMGPVEVSSSDGSGPATLGDYSHWVQIDTVVYSCAQDGLSAAEVATNIADQITANDPNCTAAADGDQGNEITVTLRPGIQGPISVTSSDGSDGATLTGLSAFEVCSNIADQINAVDWSANGPVSLSATASDNTVTITAEPGADGSAVTFYELHGSDNLKFTPATVQLAGGSSDNVPWHVSVDFDALGWTDLTKLWLTFAPALSNSAGYTPAEWNVRVTNWTVSDPNGVRPLKVAGPGSVRIEEDNPWVVRAGYWEDPSFVDPKVPAYWSRGRSIRSAYSAYETRTLTIETHCQYAHDIYLGTWLDSNCGSIQATLDGGAPATLDCYGSAMLARRLLFANVPAGKHCIVLEMTGGKNPASGGWYFYFDYLECAIPGDVPDAPQTRGDVGLATDFDTDHTYKLSPQRLIWHLQKLGLVGEVDHYCGVFWWNQRKAVGGRYPSATVTFGGSFADQDVIWVHIGDGAIGKTVFPADTPETIAAHFAYFINATLVGVWASATGPVLTITCRSTGVNWQYSLSVDTTTAHGTATVTGSLNTGAVDPTWVIDPAASQTLNRAFRDWHADYFAALKAAGIAVTVSFSQELVNPPDDPGSGQVWVQRFPGDIPVETDTGFASLKSSMCAFSAVVESYMASAYAEMAGLMTAADIPPRLQFGEVLWWYIQGATGMAFYDADTAAAAFEALARPLATFLTANDDPSVNAYADANFLRARLGNYVAGIQSAVLAQTPAALFELLWPMDVNDPDRCRLLRHVNLPPAWQSRAGSGFDTLLCEGFQYAGVDHNLDTAKRCAAYPFAELAWDRAHCRYLMGWYNLAWPWQREYQAAQRTGVPVIKFWAYDHLCLYGWPLPLPTQPSNPSFI